MDTQTDTKQPSFSMVNQQQINQVDGDGDRDQRKQQIKQWLMKRARFMFLLVIIGLLITGCIIWLLRNSSVSSRTTRDDVRIRVGSSFQDGISMASSIQGKFTGLHSKLNNYATMIRSSSGSDFKVQRDTLIQDLHESGVELAHDETVVLRLYEACSAQSTEASQLVCDARIFPFFQLVN
jgi:hypothetical protein